MANEKTQKIKLPTGKYIKDIHVNDDGVVVRFSKRKRIALLFVCINERYWPYLKQVIEDCKKYFLPQHKVDYYVWTDLPQEDTPEYKKRLAELYPDEVFMRLIQSDKKPPDQWWGRDSIRATVNYIRSTPGMNIIPAEPVEWPAPTLMRYHLFLNEEEKLSKYDYIFYMDADMRVVDKISDEVLGESLTAAPHPGYAVTPRLIPPYEPNPESGAYIQRLGRVVDEGGKPRFMPFYAAGGFQGGVSKDFIKAMKNMKASIDADFDKNYTAIWNDESHWNRFLWEYQKKGGKITFLDPSYVYPDSLIKEYYIPLWGRDYPPKIVTLTKPFSLSKQAGAELNQMMGATTHPPAQFQCPTCGDVMDVTGLHVNRMVACGGRGKPHQLDARKL